MVRPSGSHVRILEMINGFHGILYRRIPQNFSSNIIQITETAHEGLNFYLATAHSKSTNIQYESVQTRPLR